MRVYAPSTLDGLRALHEHGALPADVGFRVDDELRDAYGLAADDDEVAEFLAMALAADYAHQRADALIIVVAAEVEPSIVSWANGSDPSGAEIGRISLSQPLALHDIVSFHVGDGRSLGSNSPGSIDASDLGWWAVQELPSLLSWLE